MSATMHKNFHPCVAGAFDGGLARTAFFDGMVLTEGDMVREQSYWRGKRRLTNRALGEGVVWGLAAHWDSRSRSFCVSPGYGLSCCGDDLVVACAQTVAESELVDPCGEDFRRVVAAAVGSKGVCQPDAAPDGTIEACLLLEYVECAEDARQVYEDGCSEGEEEGCRYGAVRETTRLRLVPCRPVCAPGAIAAFWDRIQELRAKLEVENPGALVDPLRFGDEAKAWFSAAFLAQDKRVLAAQGGALPLDAAAPVTVDAQPAQAAASVRLGLEPPPGYVFTSVEVVGGASATAADALLGAFYEAGYSNTAQVNVTFKVVAAPLFGTGPGWQAHVTLALGSGPQPKLTATLSDFAELPTRTDCTSLLAGNCALTARPEAIGRTLALAGVCGWFVGRLGAAGHWKPGDPELAPDDKARALLAWSVCRLAWRGLFGIDPQLAPEAGLDQCLRQLFRAWCESMHYKGPRCECDAHGIVLGTLQLSRKGRVLSFDPWRHRRHVLTGPLLSHWTGLAGLGSLDQMVSGLAQWVCCVARMRLPPPEKGELPPDAVLRLIGGAITAPRDYGGGAEHFHGVPVPAVSALSGTDFVGELLQTALRPPKRFFGSATSLRAYVAPGKSMHLLQPNAADWGPRNEVMLQAKGMLLQELGIRSEKVAPTARRALGDFMVEVADSVTLKMLKPPPDAPAFEMMVASLEAGGIASVGDLVALGPERALERAAPQLAGQPQFADARAAEKAMALVYDNAVKAVAGAGEAVVERAAVAAEAEPFTRSDLTETALLTSVRKAVTPLLRDRALSATEFRAIALRAAGTRG